MAKRGRNPNPRLPHEKVQHFSFALDPKRPDHAEGLKKLRGWFEWCVQNLEKPKEGWTQNSMLNALMINLNDTFINDKIVSPADFEVSVQMKNGFNDMREEIRALRRMVSDLQTDLSRRQPHVPSHNSYEPPQQVGGHITERFGVSEWNDDDE